MMRVTAVGRSDVGQHRDVNEDAFHVGDSSFAVADGMGGHVAGEVASAAALVPIAQLDGRVFSDSAEATTALRDAVVRANVAVVDKSANAPSYRGMGTTLTAVMVEGRRAHIAHVGDSRAYLLRDDVFSQLTTDHTLVQRLIDEGRLTAEEAVHHPQRSVITRAIGVEVDIEVDAMSLDLHPGDRLLLCSDGLTVAVSDDAIARLLDSDDIGPIADDLIDAANDAGGPDNITAVVLAFDELATAPGPTRRPNGGDPAMVVVHTSSDEDHDWARRLGHLGSLNTDHGTTPHHGRRRLGPILMSVLLVGVLIGAGLVVGRAMLRRSWFVGVNQQDQVAIFQGVPGQIGPVRLFWVVDNTAHEIDDVPLVIRQDVRDGLTATDQADAQRIIANFDALSRQADDNTVPTQDPISPGSTAPASPRSTATTEATLTPERAPVGVTMNPSPAVTNTPSAIGVG